MGFSHFFKVCIYRHCKSLPVLWNQDTNICTYPWMNMSTTSNGKTYVT